MVSRISAAAPSAALAVRTATVARRADPVEPVAPPRRLPPPLDPWRADGVAAYGVYELPPRVLDVYR